MSSAPVEPPKRVLVPIADGSEEIETTCITDTLARFGASVTVASANADGSLLCTMSRGLRISACATVDAALASGPWDLVVLPGGMPGAEHLRDCAPLIAHLKDRAAGGLPYGAVCASPAVVLATHGLLPGPAATCYPAPGFLKAVGEMASEEEVVVSGCVATSQGPGTSLKFGLMLGEMLYGKEKADKIAAEMLVVR